MGTAPPKKFGGKSGKDYQGGGGKSQGYYQDSGSQKSSRYREILKIVLIWHRSNYTQDAYGWKILETL